MTWGQAATGIISALLVLIGTWITARFSRKTGEEANENAAATARTADWEGFAREQREWTEDRLAERDRRIEELALQVENRDRRLEAVESRLDMLEAKYRQAIAYIRRLVRQLQRHVEPDEIETPPDEIAPDL